MTVLTEIPAQVNIADEVELAIETYELGKIYRTGFWMNQKVESLKKCTLQVDRGETFGLLGLNGAGKTTLLKSLLSIVRPTRDATGRSPRARARARFEWAVFPAQAPPRGA